MSKLFRKSVLILIPILICSTLIACTPNNNVTGMILSPEKAYERELINSDDLQNIAYYMGCAGDTEFSPAPKKPEFLSGTTENAIKYLYLKDIQNEFHEATINDVSIDAYYGMYGSCIAVRLSNKLVRYDLGFVDVEIGGVMFYHYCGLYVSIVVIDEIGH